MAGSNPVWLQVPDASVVTAAGTPPEPLTAENVIVTPESPTPPLVTVPDTPNGELGPVSAIL